MTDQLILSIVIIGLLVFFISGKYRYDYVSLGALALLILFDIIKIENAFIGFSHPAVVTVALVLLISKGLQDAGLSAVTGNIICCLLYTSPSPRDQVVSRMPSSA